MAVGMVEGLGGLCPWTQSKGDCLYMVALG